MSARLVPVLGVLAGIVAAVLLIGGLVAFLPDPVPSPTPVPTPIGSLPSPVRSVDASASPSASPSGALGSAGASPSLIASGSPPEGAFHVGEPAPPLSVARLGGGTIDLAQLAGKPVWINFMATWCPSCRDELPLMNGYAARYAGNGLTIVAVDVREPTNLVQPYVSSLKVLFPVGLDTDGAAMRAWGAFALPVHFWVDAQGVVRDGALGGIGPDIMVEGLRRIMPGVTVTP